MGFLKDTKEQTQQESAQTVYQKLKAEYLKADGLVHVAMINSFSKWINQIFDAETKYINNIDTILTMMQQDGFQIMDVKFNSIQNQGLTGQMEGYHTLIVYRWRDPDAAPAKVAVRPVSK